MDSIIYNWLSDFIEKDELNDLLKRKIDQISNNELHDLKRIMVEGKKKVYPTSSYSTLLLENFGFIRVEYDKKIDTFPIAYPTFRGMWYWWTKCKH